MKISLQHIFIVFAMTQISIYFVSAKNEIQIHKPEVNITTSTICNICTCDILNKLLDCSNRKISRWFSNEEWSILQDSQFKFDTINMEYNNLTVIPRIATYSMKNLRLGFNQINNISLGAFQNLSELVSLDLSHNKLTSKIMVPDVFKGKYSTADYLPLGNMRNLNLSYNELHNLDADIFEHLPKLEVLVLSKNTFQVIDHLTETAIAGLTSLKFLDISYMELNDLPDNFLHGPRDLNTLILTGNLLDELPDNLDLAINLKELVLDENPIKEFAGENIFPVMRKLEILSISYMPELTMIGRGALCNLQSLTTLIAANNPKLSIIDKAAFAKSTNNPIIFDYPPIEKLIMHNDNLTTLDRNLIQRWDKIKSIDLRYNSWNCDCSNYWLIKTLISQINSTTPRLTEEVVCNSPITFAGLSLLHINKKNILLDCIDKNYSNAYSLLAVGLLSGILLGIPLTIGFVKLYRRGCFGLLHQRTGGTNRLSYNRASFTDDFHI